MSASGAFTVGVGDHGSDVGRDGGADVLSHDESDGGIEAGNAGTSVVLKNNQGFTGAAFKDGTSPLGPLNSFVLSFKDYTLSFWGADADGLPVFSDEGNINGVDIDYDDDVIVLN